MSNICGRFIIYLVVNKNNGKLYVGQSRRKDAKSRLLEHIRHAINYGLSGCPYFHPAIRKHGKESFYATQIDEASSQKELNRLEREWILKLGTLDHDIGYNVHEGGGNSLEVGEETRAKISAVHKGRKHSPEHTQKIVETLYGRPVSAETRQKMREAKQGEKAPGFRKDITLEKILPLLEEGFSIHKIAQTLGTSTDTIDYRLGRRRRRDRV